MARPNEPDMPAKRTKKIRLGIDIFLFSICMVDKWDAQSGNASENVFSLIRQHFAIILSKCKSEKLNFWVEFQLKCQLVKGVMRSK